ncbi:MAG TPA: HIRAN domain-containing protein [Acidimicrobiales bacterium]|nr:HIRAN domain-containing protein [Acidimicrobiales bacterium]
MRTLQFKVVGLTFVPGYPDNLYRLQEVAAERYLTGPSASFGDHDAPEPLPVVLIRDPDNKYDANAIEVHVPALGRHGMIGHVPAKDPAIASKLAPLLDKGEVWKAGMTAVLVHPDNPDNPGIEIRCERQS